MGANERLHLDRNCPDNHVHLPQYLYDWLADTNTDAKHIVQMERIRRENPQIRRSVMAATADDVTRHILVYLDENNGTATYSGLAQRSEASAKTVKRRVRELEQNGVVHVSDSRPPTVAFSCENAQILTKDTLSCYYDSLVKNFSKNSSKQHNNRPPHMANWTDSVHLENLPNVVGVAADD